MKNTSAHHKLYTPVKTTITSIMTVYVININNFRLNPKLLKNEEIHKTVKSFALS
jgi:hypothetical protein